MEKDTETKRTKKQKKDELIKGKTMTGKPVDLIDLEPTTGDNQKNEAVESTAVFTFGRMNPPTIGHQKLIDKVRAVASSMNAMPHVFLSHTQNNKKDPLDYNMKVNLAKTAFGNIVTKSNAKTIIDVAKELEKMGHENLVLVVGSDRVAEFDRLLNKYNGKDFNFKSIKVVSAGARDPDAEGVEGMSASKMRELAKSNAEDQFKGGLPRKLQSKAAAIMDRVRKGMGLSEAIVESVDIEEALTMMQRMKRRQIMKRLQPRIKMGRERAKKRMADTKRLQKRARKHAIQKVRAKFAGEKGRQYATLSPAEKIAIDKRIEGKKKIIDRIAAKLLPKEKKAELLRLQTVRHKKVNEATSTPQDKDINSRSGTQPARYHSGLSPATKAKRDAQFKKQARMSDDDPRAYKPAPGDATAKTRPSKYTIAVKKMFGEARQAKDSVEAENIIVMLRKAVNLRGQKDVVFANGDKRKIPQNAAAYALQIHDRLRTSIQKDNFAKKLAASPASMAAALKSPETAGDPPPKRDRLALPDMEKAIRRGMAKQRNESTEAQSAAKEKHAREKETLKRRHDREMDAARSKDTRTANMAEQFTLDQFDVLMELALIDEKSMDGLKKKSEKSGISYGTLKKVYDRGVAAWKTGHRPGTTPQQWGYARVNAFIAKKKSGKLNHDQDLAHYQPQGEMIDEIHSVDQEKSAKTYAADTPKMKLPTSPAVDGVPNAKGEIPKPKVTDINEAFEGMFGGIWAKPAPTVKDISNPAVDKFYRETFQLDPDLAEAIRIDEYCEECDLYEDLVVEEAEYQGKKVKLNDPIRTNENPKKKFKVYVKNDQGNVVVVRFGDPGLSIKRDDPDRRRSFRARHNCDNPGPKWKARYWSCYQWRAGSKVDN